MLENPIVSVTIVTRNRAHLVGESIQSVLDQTYKDFELIVIDHCSSDNTREAVNAFGDDRLHYIYLSEKLGGAAFSRNAGLEVAKGKYIAILDDDDIWVDKDKLRQQVEFLEAHADYVLVGTNYIVVDENGNETGRTAFLEKDEEIRNRMLKANYFCHSSVVYRKKEALAFGGYQQVKGTSCLRDEELWLQLGTVGKVANLSIYGVSYTQWSGNISANRRLFFSLLPIAQTFRYRDKYPNWKWAIAVHLIGVLYAFLQIIGDLPFLSSLKRFIKRRCPIIWQILKYFHRRIFT